MTILYPFKCDICGYNAIDDTSLSLHKIRSHEEYGNMHQKDSMMVFCNAMGKMMMDNNELIAKMNGDTNKNMGKMIETQGKLEESIGCRKTEIQDLKFEIVRLKENKAENVKTNDAGGVAKDGASTTNNKKNKEHTPKVSNVRHAKNQSQEERVSWIGTSISKALDKSKFEKDLNVNLNITKAYCIKEEANARYKEANFKAIVPEVIEKQEPDVVVLQTGSIEITNIDVKRALMDSERNIDEYKKEWFEKVEEDSKNLFDVAQNALKKNNKVKKVIILKRLPRHDTNSSDPIGIKSQLSKYANSI